MPYRSCKSTYAFLSCLINNTGLGNSRRYKWEKKVQGPVIPVRHFTLSLAFPKYIFLAPSLVFIIASTHQSIFDYPQRSGRSRVVVFTTI
ncbi:hypothetical protein EYC80_002374 [Monilinia laxa]|uniref:Uncharacterized protein n=1 Tax=Monilinia laxa TaxID=61186 RepID=A0A5N6K3L3_MONLA|nr:hypothetical protein EYC80_002374 [Monilinia laxa]